ncbi:MAG: TetR/AcrR family transcriptional regulator [Erythrobacter sp.]
MVAKKDSKSAMPRVRTYDPVQTRASIIEAGLKLFNRDGFSGTAVKDIADEAGVTKGAFYHHFESKEDLLLLIHDDYIEYQLGVIEEIVARDLTPTEQLRTMIDAILHALDKYQANVTIFFQERRYLSGPKFEHIRKRRDELEGVFRKLLVRGIETGEFRSDMDVAITGLGIIGMCAWSYQWYVPEGRLKLDEVARIFSQLVMDGVAAPAP